MYFYIESTRTIHTFYKGIACIRNKKRYITQRIHIQTF